MIFIFSLSFISSFREGCRTDFFGKSGRSLNRWITTRLTGRSPVTLPPGLGISTSGLNFADSKITATVTDGTCKARQDINVSQYGYKIQVLNNVPAYMKQELKEMIDNLKGNNE